jgi:hypothetical protein
MDLLLAVLGGEFSVLYFYRLALLSDSERIRELLIAFLEEPYLVTAQQIIAAR